MHLEWFDRVCSELQENLESICDKYDQVGHMSVDRAAKHPRIEFYVETMDNEREYFCTLFFDPHNEEFYIESFDIDLEQTSRTLLSDIEDIIDAVHESFHAYMNDDEFVEEEYVTMEDDERVNDKFMEVDVEWTTDEVTAFTHEDDVDVTYQFGIVEDTGDGILRRINRIRTTEDEMIEDESNFIFSKEEAGTIISMIASNMNSLSELDFDHYDHF